MLLLTMISTSSSAKTSRPLMPGPVLPIGGPGIDGTSLMASVARKPRKNTGVPSSIVTSPSVIVRKNGSGSARAGSTRDRPTTATELAAPIWMKPRRVVPRAGASPSPGAAGGVARRLSQSEARRIRRRVPSAILLVTCSASCERSCSGLIPGGVASRR
ncbi:MAG: hypothetical protein E6G10_08580 [Actinobacteria bacterium]|nr:MAG: hypothetical protein E6G10_08580 [Actinomycetota bacterium]